MYDKQCGGDYPADEASQNESAAFVWSSSQGQVSDQTRPGIMTPWRTISLGRCNGKYQICLVWGCILLMTIGRRWHGCLCLYSNNVLLYADSDLKGRILFGRNYYNMICKKGDLEQKYFLCKSLELCNLILGYTHFVDNFKLIRTAFTVLSSCSYLPYYTFWETFMKNNPMMKR